MGDRIAFPLLTEGGLAGTAATPTLLDYVQRNGDTPTKPAITHLGNGVFVFRPTGVNVAHGVAFVVDAGAGFVPRYTPGAVCPDTEPFVAVLVLDAITGALWAGSAPSVGLYMDFEGLEREAPELLQMQTYLFAMTPTPADVLKGVVAQFIAPPGSIVLPYTASLARTLPAVPDQEIVQVSSMEPIEDGLRAWIMKATGLDTDHVVFAEQGKSDQGGAIPSKPYATVRIGDSLSVSSSLDEDTDLERDAGQEIIQQSKATEAVRVSVQFFSDDTTGDSTGIALARQARQALELPVVREALELAGVTIFDEGKAQNLSALRGTRFEARGVLDVGIYMLNIMRQYTTYIEEVETEDFMGPPNSGTSGEIDI